MLANISNSFYSIISFPVQYCARLVMWYIPFNWCIEGDMRVSNCLWFTTKTPIRCFWYLEFNNFLMEMLCITVWSPYKLEWKRRKIVVRIWCQLHANYVYFVIRKCAKYFVTNNVYTTSKTSIMPICLMFLPLSLLFASSIQQTITITFVKHSADNYVPNPSFQT